MKTPNVWKFILIVIISLALFVRFYNFTNRITFWSEQARSLVVSANYIKEKPSLLGQEYFRTDSNGHKLFTGAIFNYSLVPLLLISNYDPIFITAFFTILNIFTGLVIYWVVKRIFNEKLAIASTFLFLLSDIMIYHSLFIWDLNYMPLIGILIIYFLWSWNKNKLGKNVFWIALLSGLGISLQYMFIPIAGVVFLLVFFRSKNKFRDASIFLIGTALGNLPMILFDIRHNFYHLSTLWQYTLDTLKGGSDAGFNYYYLLPFWPAFAILSAFILLKIFKFNKVVAVGIVATYLYLNMISPRVSFLTPTGMPKGMVVKDISTMSRIIANDVNGSFNVAEVLDFDKRAYVLRYYLEFVDGKKPLGEIDYKNLDTLYVLSQKDYNFEKSNIWEVTAGGPYEVGELSKIGNDFAIYKLFHKLK